MENNEHTLLIVKEVDPFLFGLSFAAGALVSITIYVAFSMIWIAFFGLFV